MSERRNRPAGNGAVSTKIHGSGCTEYMRGLRHRRQDAALRAEPLACGHRDPLTCCHHNEPLTDRGVDGYRDAAEHLFALGLSPHPFTPELRALWRRGGHDRATAVRIAERWELAS